MSISHISHAVTLNNGVKMPQLGLGVYKVEEGSEVVNAVKWALETGYRHIDTAALYQNEEGVGQEIRESGIPREDIFVTTKVWNSDQGYESTLQAFETSRRKLGLDYVDLYLVHWPVKGKYKDTYRALEKLYNEGLTRAIGVSNFQTHHIDDLLTEASTVPAVNQVELHPLLSQEPLRAYCNEKNIHVTAWSPLMHGNLDIPELIELGKKHGKTPAQIIIRWDLQKGIITIPKSIRAERIRENANVFDFELSTEDIAIIDGLNRNHRQGADPDNFDF